MIMKTVRVVACAFLLAALVQNVGGKRQSPNIMQAKFAGVETEALLAVNNTQVGAMDASTDSKFGPPTWSGWLKHLFAGVSVAILFKMSCLASNVMVHVSPFAQVQEWETKGSTGDADPAPYVSIALGGWQWCIYGVAACIINGNDSFLLLVYANCLGALLGSYYTFAFYRWCRHDTMWPRLTRYLRIVAFVVVAQTGMWIALPHQRALLIHSLAAATCSFLMSISLLACIPSMVRSNDASSLCGPLVLANFFGALMWAYRGYSMNDLAIISTNIFAAFSSACCLYVKYRYGLAGAECVEASDGGKMGNTWGMKRMYHRKCPTPMQSQAAVPQQESQLVEPAK